MELKDDLRDALMDADIASGEGERFGPYTNAALECFEKWLREKAVCDQEGPITVSDANVLQLADELSAMRRGK